MFVFKLEQHDGHLMAKGVNAKYVNCVCVCNVLIDDINVNVDIEYGFEYTSPNIFMILFSKML